MPRKQRKLLRRYIVADRDICHGKPTFVGTLSDLHARLKQAFPELQIGAIHTFNRHDLFEINLGDDILYVSFDDRIRAFRIGFEHEHYGNEIPDFESTFRHISEILAHWF
jgi:hypothetical protein